MGYDGIMLWVKPIYTLETLTVFTQVLHVTKQTNPPSAARWGYAPIFAAPERSDLGSGFALSSGLEASPKN